MQTTITKENIEKFQSYGFVLTPVNKSSNPKLDKKPKTKKSYLRTNYSSLVFIILFYTQVTK